MGMLTQEDLKQIGDVIDEKMDAKFVKFEDRVVDRIVGEVGELIEDNFLPAVEVLIEDKLVPIRATMITKEYLDEKLGKVGGKINVLVDVLHRNHTLSDEQRGIVHAA